MTAERGAAVALRNIGLKAWRRLRAAHKPIVRIARRHSRDAERRAALREVAGLERGLERIASSRGPIIVGPWLAEVGYEALYWVPFVRWFQDAYRIQRERLVVVSRGGVGDWYGDITDRYVELFDLMPPDELSALNEARRHESEAGGRKQTSAAALDDELLRRVAARHTVGDAESLHPSVLFRLFRHVWYGTLPFDYFWTHTRYRPVTTSAVLPDDVPAEFTAVKLYTGMALPADAWTHARLRALVAAAAAVRPVITLDTALAVDEHADFTFADIPNVMSAARWMTPATNLAVQSALVARASRFVGTCGGVAWLAPFLGTPTVAVYADDRLLTPHLYIARQAGHRAGAAEFLPFDLRAEARVIE
jgi:hypothetical protein